MASQDRMIPEEILTELGRVVVSWSGLESMMQEAVAGLIDANPAFCVALTSGVSTSTLADVMRTVLNIRLNHDEHSLAAFRDVLQRIDGLRGERNIYIHGEWSTDDDTCVFVQTVRPERHEIVQRLVVTEPDLSDLVQDIAHVTLEFVALCRGFGLLPPPRT